MFDILFGWRKASKCKKLIRRVQCRLKLLNNKRSTIVRQLRDDVSVLLKNGHAQTAFDRVEQLFKDECLLAVYDLLDNFCEFIVNNLSYIRRNKDCPNDINEAMSSLIFASARFGDLPELRSIRKLFGERYGQRFTMVALELLPGNLVNRQMREKMCIKSASDDEKSRLVEEILKSTLWSGPLLLEYSSELQQKMEDKSSDGDPIPAVETNIKEGEGKMVNVDFSSENKIPKDLASDSTTLPSSYRMVEKETTPETIISSGHEKNQGLITTWATGISPSGAEASDLQQLERSLVLYDSAVVRQEEGNAIDESSSEGSAQLPQEMIYLDDIQELESPSVSKEGNLLDQRMFKFRSSAVPIRGKIDNSKDETPDQGRFEDFHVQKLASRSFKKNRNSTSRRLRRRSVSGDGTSMNDVECSSYYGESSDSSLDHEPIFHVRQKDHKRNPMKLPQNTYVVQEIPIDPSFMKDRSSSSRFRFTKQAHDRSKSGSSCTLGEKQNWDYMPQKPIIQLKVRHCCCSCQKNRQVPETKNGMPLNQEGKKYQDDASPTSIISTCSGSSNSSRSSREGMPSYLRAMTMPLERDKDAAIDSMLRSNSFPLRDHDQLSSNRHVHPKLPDYDELAAKFMALKKANLQRV